MRRRIVIDGTIDPDHEVSLGPGVGRKCAHGPCQRRLHPDDPPSKEYHHPKCRTAAWKARRASSTASGVVAVRFLGSDAKNGVYTGQSARAGQLRSARASGPVASDKRVQWTRAVEEFAATLRYLNLPWSECERLARRAADRALPERRRP